MCTVSSDYYSKSVLLSPDPKELLCGRKEHKQTFSGQINVGKAANHPIFPIVEIQG